ncbi:hypothetical protein C8R47DRAFT_1209498 [Mycena vitilis]|nr:hypothetical protein C8R47DRAFT_1209498 [Mycena vitilis]
MAALLALNLLLATLLATTNWDRLRTPVSWLYSWLYLFVSRWVTTSTILGFYGLLILYLLVVVHVPGTAQRRHKRLIPYYDHEGQLKGWVREEIEGDPKTRPVHDTTSPRLPSPGGRHLADVPTIASAPSASQKNLAQYSLPSWDGFPDGQFRCHFTPQQIEDTSRLSVYWVADKRPGKRGSPSAVTPEKGKISSFKCAGIIKCKTSICTVRIAPGTNIAKQLEAFCACGEALHHRSCKVEWSIIFYRDGAVFDNSGLHNHSAYTHSLPVRKGKKTLQLETFISRQPIPLRPVNMTGSNASSEYDDLPLADSEAVNSDELEGDECGSTNDEEDADRSEKPEDSGDNVLLDHNADENEDSDTQT